MTQRQTIVVERRGATEWVTMNRPDRLNALDDVMVGELSDYFRALATDRDVRVRPVAIPGAWGWEIFPTVEAARRARIVTVTRRSVVRSFVRSVGRATTRSGERCREGCRDAGRAARGARARDEER